jgi:hypothetical protein
VKVIERGLVHASGSQLALHALRHEAQASDNDGGDYGGEGATLETRNHLSDLIRFERKLRRTLIAPIGNRPNLKAKAPYGGCMT